MLCVRIISVLLINMVAYKYIQALNVFFLLALWWKYIVFYNNNKIIMYEKFKIFIKHVEIVWKLKFYQKFNLKLSINQWYSELWIYQSNS